MGITSGSGYTASCQFRRSYYSTTSVSLASSITGTGVIQCALSATASAALKDGRYVYDVELAFPDGTIVRQQQGNVTVDPEVSK